MKISAVPFKRLIGSSFLGLTICLSSLPTQALTVKEVPNPRHISGNWVTDSAEILSPGTEAQLNQMINQLESKNGAEVAVVTVPETKSAASPKAFATELFNYWHIGKKGRDNGVLFLISKGDRRVEIETGYGVEAILPDAKVGNIIDTEILPRFKQNDFNGGTLAGTRSMIVTLEPSLTQELQVSTEHDRQPSQNSNNPDLGSWLFWIFFVLAIGGGIFQKCYSSNGSNSGSSSGSDSGGSDFGGGDSGGGGAGGSW